MDSPNWMLAYIAVCFPLVYFVPNGWARAAAFALVNVGFIFFRRYGVESFAGFAFHLGFVLVYFVLLRGVAAKPGRFGFAAAMLAPILVLVIAKADDFAEIFGISYLALRLVLLGAEVRDGVAAPPGLLNYLCFAFYAPLQAMGPIASYADFVESFAKPRVLDRRDAARAAVRIAVGLFKYRLLANALLPLTSENLLLDGYYHGVLDFAAAFFGYYLYLYCNFSGFIDIALGISALFGINIPENFRNPFLACNIQDFWRRWHVSLMTFMRDLLFRPLLRRTGAALAILVTFVVTGVWHGFKLNFLLYGALNGVAVLACSGYGAALRRLLGTVGFTRYQASKPILAVRIVATNAFVAVMLQFFANDLAKLRLIADAFKWAA